MIRLIGYNEVKKLSPDVFYGKATAFMTPYELKIASKKEQVQVLLQNLPKGVDKNNIESLCFGKVVKGEIEVGVSPRTFPRGKTFVHNVPFLFFMKEDFDPNKSSIKKP